MKRAGPPAVDRRYTAIILALLALGLAGCGDDGGEVPAVSADVEGPGEVVRSGPVAGSIQVSPDTVEAGGELEFTVSNEGSETLTHGVCPSYERLDGDAWVEATEDVLGGAFACIELAAVVEPGEAGAPQTVTVADAIDGTYRAVLGVTGEAGRGITLRDAFSAYPP